MRRVIPRSDPHLNEGIDALDQHLELHIDKKGEVNYRAAFASLGREELAFVEEEVDRCAFDLLYYLENYHVILADDGSFKTLFPFWGSQDIFYAWFTETRAKGGQTKGIVLKGRQEGLSTLIQAIILWLTMFNEGFASLLVAHEPGAAGKIFDMSRRAWEHLPWWMRPEKRYEAMGKWLVFDRDDALDRLRHPGLQSSITVQAANKVTGVGVGQTYRAAHLSELPRWVDPGILNRDLLPTLHAPDLFAVMESTAVTQGDFWHSLWNDSLEGRLDWDPIFIPFYRRPEYSLPIPEDEKFVRTPEEEAIAKRVKEETPDHFEFTDEIFNWRRAKIAFYISTEGDEWLFRRDYPITDQESFQASGLCAFDKKKLQSMLDIYACKPRWVGEIGLKIENGNAVAAPVFPGGLKKFPSTEKLPIQKHKGARLFIWEGPEPGARYQIGGDVAQGIEGGDFSSAQVFKISRAPHPDVQVAEWHGWIKPTPFAHVLAGLGYFYNTAEIACEANDVGKKVNDELVRGVAYPKFYRWKRIDKLTNFQTDYIGWETNIRTRPQLIGDMGEAVDGGAKVLILRSEYLIKQMMSFGQEEPGGRIEGQGEHDDRVMSACITFTTAHELEYGNVRQQDTGEIDPSDPLYHDCVMRVTRHLGEVLRNGVIAKGFGLDGALAPGAKIPETLIERESEKLYRRLKRSSQNYETAFSPVFDKAGPRQDMHFRDHVPPEMILLSELKGDSSEDVPEDELWKTKW